MTRLVCIPATSKTKKNRRSEGMKRAWKNPLFRARWAAASRRMWESESHRLKMEKSKGNLSENELQQVVLDLHNTDRRYVDIAIDWLISEQRVVQIASKYGIRRYRRMTPAQKIAVVDAINERPKRRYIDIANQYGISICRVSQIARAIGIRRQVVGGPAAPASPRNKGPRFWIEPAVHAYGMRAA